MDKLSIHKKSFSLRVTKNKLLDMAMEAICASSVVIGCPECILLETISA